MEPLSSIEYTITTNFAVIQPKPHILLYFTGTTFPAEMHEQNFQTAEQHLVKKDVSMLPGQFQVTTDDASKSFILGWRGRKICLFQLTQVGEEYFIDEIPIGTHPSYLHDPPAFRRNCIFKNIGNYLFIYGGEGCNCDRNLYLFDINSNVFYKQKHDLNFPAWRMNMYCGMIENADVFRRNNLIHKNLESNAQFGDYKQPECTDLESDGLLFFGGNDYNEPSYEMYLCQFMTNLGYYFASLEKQTEFIEVKFCKMHRVIVEMPPKLHFFVSYCPCAGGFVAVCIESKIIARYSVFTKTWIQVPYKLEIGYASDRNYYTYNLGDMIVLLNGDGNIYKIDI